jgi:hypothetical protein
MTEPEDAPQWRCYCPISLCRALDRYGIRHALAYIRRTYAAQVTEADDG